MCGHYINHCTLNLVFGFHIHCHLNFWFSHFMKSSMQRLYPMKSDDFKVTKKNILCFDYLIKVTFNELYRRLSISLSQHCIIYKRGTKELQFNIEYIVNLADSAFYRSFDICITKHGMQNFYLS